MKAAQRKRRLAVIKFGLRTQRQPSFADMAVLTRNLQRPMRISVGRRHAGVFLTGSRAQQQEQGQEPVYIPGFESPQNFLFGSFGLATCGSRARESYTQLSQAGVLGCRLLRGGSSLSDRTICRVISGLIWRKRAEVSFERARVHRDARRYALQVCCH